MDKTFITTTQLTDGQIGIFYIGQVGFIIKYKNKYILIDGYLSDYVDKNCYSEISPWVRSYPAPIDPKELDFIDYVFATHSHFDHADPETLGIINKVNDKAKFIVPKAILSTIESYGISKNRILGVPSYEKVALDESISFTAIPSAHEELHKDENGDFLEVGFRFAFGDISLFHGGDGCPYCGLEEQLMGCNILMLPVNGRDYYRRYVCDIIGNFTSREAVLIAKNCGADLLIPTHFDLYDINGINPAEFVDTLYKENPYQKFHIFKPGEKFIYEK